MIFLIDQRWTGSPSNRGHDYFVMSRDVGWDGSGFSLNVYQAQSYYQAGYRLRVVVTWASTATCTYSSPPYNCIVDVPDADLDLHVYDPNGAPVGSSTSYNNNYEIVDIPITNTTGNYTIKIKKFGFYPSSTYFGIAWTRYLP